MNQEKQDTSIVLMDTMVTKLEMHDQRIQTHEKEIAAIKVEVGQIPDCSKDIQEIKTGLQSFLLFSKKLEFPAAKMLKNVRRWFSPTPATS